MPWFDDEVGSAGFLEDALLTTAPQTLLLWQRLIPTRRMGQKISGPTCPAPLRQLRASLNQKIQISCRTIRRSRGEHHHNLKEGNGLRTLLSARWILPCICFEMEDAVPCTSKQSARIRAWSSKQWLLNTPGEIFQYVAQGRASPTHQLLPYTLPQVSIERSALFT